MLRALIFDFNGVLVDDEPLHFKLFQRVLGEEGLGLSKEDYYERYLGMDDRGCFKTALRANGREADDAAIAELIRRKAAYYRESIAKGATVFPGVKKLVPVLSSRYPLAIASGALRSEIDMILQSITLKEFFQAIVSTEDVEEGKPSPEIFIKALHRLNDGMKDHPILASECLVVEDSKEGILGAHRAGMKCLAVANSHPPAELTEAEAVVATLEEVDIAFLEKLVP